MGNEVLQPVTSSGLQRTSAHRQFNRKAFGFYFMGRTMPIVLHTKKPGGGTYNYILMFGPRYHKDPPFQDYGIREVCCRKVFLFNLKHWLKCWLPTAIGSNGEIRTPYTHNLCEKCDVAIQDSNGHTIQTIMKRDYRVDKFIWRAPQTLQDEKSNMIHIGFQKGLN